MSCDVENCTSEIGRHSNLKLNVRKIRYRNENSEKTASDEKDLKIDSALFRMTRKNPKKSPMQRSCCSAEHGAAASHTNIKKSSASAADPCDSNDSNEQ